MALQFPPFSLLTWLAAIVSLLAGVVVVHKRDTPGAVPLALIFLAATIWSTSSTIQLVSTEPAQKVFWSNAQFLGIVIVPAAWLVFAIEYTGYGDWLTPRRLGLLAIEPTIVLGLIVTNGIHGVFRSNPHLQTSGQYTYVHWTYEIGFWAHSAYSYILLAAGALLIVFLLVQTDTLYRSQVGALIVGVLVPWTANVFVLTGAVPPGVHLTPIAFIVSGIALTWAVFRHDFLASIPITRNQSQSTVIATMEDAVVILDSHYGIIDSNPAAAVLLDHDDPTGRDLASVLPETAHLLIDPSETTTHHLSIERGGTTRYYDAQITPLDRYRGAPTGYMLVMRDITERERHRQRLEVLNRVLRHDLRNQMNVLLAYTDDLLTDPDALETHVANIREKGLEITDLSQKARHLEQTLSDDDIVLERINISQVLQSNLETLGESYPDVMIESRIPDDVYILANTLIGTAIENLLENAIQHNEHPTKAVRVTVEHAPIDSDLIEVSITDNGPGIPANERSVLERGSETQLEHSSGLGLWLANWIVTESGGDIEFSDNVPVGTTMIVRLLTAPVDLEASHVQSDQSGRQSGSS